VTHRGPDISAPSPVLVTGAIRSGTTWLGELLGRSPALEYVWEPFNPLVRAWPHNRVPHFMTGPYDAQPAVDGIADRLMQLRSGGRLLAHPEAVARELRRRRRFAAARRAGRRPLLKDPLAVLLARHLEDRYGAAVVLCVRDPAAFVSSCLRLGWDYDFENLLAQPLLMRRLEPWRAEMEARTSRRGPMIERVTLLWRVIYGALATGDLAPTHPLVVRHEIASTRPVETLRAVCAHVGVPLTPELESAAEQRADAGRAESWRQHMTADQIAAVRTATAAEAEHWGSWTD
jgi:hypothetical protein